MNYIKILYQKSGCKTIKEFAEKVDLPKRTIEDYLYKENNKYIAKLGGDKMIFNNIRKLTLYILI